MTEGSFFRELKSLVKKHFGRGDTAEDRPPERGGARVATVCHDSSGITDRGTQEELQRLCEQLFQKRDMITSGRLRFVGLEEVKKHMGENWEGVKLLVYKRVEGAIKQYLDPEDLFIRYHDDQYIIIFADAAYEEAEIRTALIAAEIRRRMFGTRRRELEGLQIKHDVRAVRTEELRDSQNIVGAVRAIHSGKSDKTLAATGNRRPFAEEQKGTKEPGAKGRNGSQDARAETTQDTRIVEVDAYKGHLRQYAKRVKRFNVLNGQD